MGDRILITGANGFVGRRVAGYLAAKGAQLNLAVRAHSAQIPSHARTFTIGNISATTDWRQALEGASVVIHTAAHVHELSSHNQSSVSFFDVNVGGTKSLANLACRSGVKTFVNISTIAVYAPTCDSDLPLTEDTDRSPVSDYGKSKLEAEEIVASLASAEFSTIQLRPPLIHGNGARGNWPRLEKLARLPIPPPSIASNNRRSVLAVHNLCDAIWKVIGTTSQNPISGSYNITDNGYVSTDDLIRWTREGLGRRPMLMPGTAYLIKKAATGMGAGHSYNKVAGNLTVDSSKFSEEFRWSPPLSTRDAIVQDYGGAAILKTGFEDR